MDNYMAKKIEEVIVPESRYKVLIEEDRHWIPKEEEDQMYELGFKQMSTPCMRRLDKPEEGCDIKKWLRWDGYFFTDDYFVMINAISFESPNYMLIWKAKDYPGGVRIDDAFPYNFETGIKRLKELINGSKI